LVAGCAAALLAMLSAGTQAVAQDLPNPLNLREARALTYDAEGPVTWDIRPHESLSAADLATLDQLNRIQPQPYYAAMAIHPP
jgi:hypothetical protein